MAQPLPTQPQQELQQLAVNAVQEAATGTSSNAKSRSSGRSKQFSAPTAAISVSGPYLTTSSIDGDSLIMSAEFLERELVGPYKFTKHQVC